MRIHLPAETWAEVFAWLNRRDFARKMEQLWDREFSPIAEKWLHEWSSNVKIDQLEFGKKNEQAKLLCLSCWQDGHIPIAEVDMPKNIYSFELIRISHLDNTILAFLRRMQPLFRNNIRLSLYNYWGQEGIPIALDHLLPMFSGGEFESVKLKGTDDVSLLSDANYSPALLNTKMLVFWHYNNSGMWLRELLANWLFTKRATAVDGQPRMLVLPCHGNYERLATTIQQRFMAATTEEAFPSFIVLFRFDSEQEFIEKTLKNDGNGQQLIMRKVSDTDEASSDKDIVFISCPVDVNQEQLAEWEAKVADAEYSSTEREIQIYHPTLGPLDPIDQQPQQQQQPGSSSEANASEQPGTSKMLLKRNAQNEEVESEEEKEEGADCDNEKKNEKRALLYRVQITDHQSADLDSSDSAESGSSDEEEEDEEEEDDAEMIMDEQIWRVLRDKRVPQYARTLIDKLARKNQALKRAALVNRNNDEQGEQQPSAGTVSNKAQNEEDE